MRVACCSVRPDKFSFDIHNLGGLGNTNDVILAGAFGATMHYPAADFESLRQFDLVCMTMWKNQHREFESRWLEIGHRLKDAGVRVVLYQESEISWPTTRPWEEMKSFIELLQKVDLFLTHNTPEIALWGEARKNRPTYRWRTCLDLEPRLKARIEPNVKSARIILFGNSYDSRANGLTGLIACKDFGRPLMHQDRCPHYEQMSRELPELLGIKVEHEVANCGWMKWAERIAPAYIAVHPMPAAAAGRDQITFAALGIPCVGNRELDVQMELFPQLSVTCYDVVGIRKLVRMLLEDNGFYNEQRQFAIDRVAAFGLKSAELQASEIKDRMGW